MKYIVDLKARCYQFSLDIINFIDTLPHIRSCYVIGDQLLRSGTSVGANLVEGSASSSRLEFKKYHEIALKSANETKYRLSLLRDSGKTKGEVVNKYIKEINEISCMIAAGVIKLKEKLYY